MSKTWTTADLALIRHLVAVDKLNGPELAKRFNVSRGAMMGKLAREGIKLKRQPVRPGSRPQPSKPRVKANLPARNITENITSNLTVLLPAPDMPPIELGSHVTGVASAILRLERGQCRWPTGDPKKGDFKFCEEMAVGGPYCADHAEVAFIPIRLLQPRRPS